MGTTGIVRRLDELGRIVLPMELRKTLDLKVRDSIEITVEKGSIVLRKYSQSCVFCGKENNELDYKDVNKLKRYVSERGKILPRRITGNCAKHQRALTVAVKRARHIVIMPYVQD